LLGAVDFMDGDCTVVFSKLLNLITFFKTQMFIQSRAHLHTRLESSRPLFIAHLDWIKKVLFQCQNQQFRHEAS